MDALHKEVKALIKKRLSEAAKSHRASALLAEGKRRHSRTHRASALLAEGKRRHSRMPRASAMLAGSKRMPAKRKAPEALLEINKIARDLKKKHPHLMHKEAISEAAALYRQHKKSHSMRRAAGVRRTHHARK